MLFTEFEMSLLENGWIQSNTTLKTSGNTRLIEFESGSKYVSVVQKHDGSYTIVAGHVDNQHVASTNTSFKDFWENYG